MADDVISEACFTASTRDRPDELAAMDLTHDYRRSDTVMICMNFNSYASLVIFFIIPILLLNTKLYEYYHNTSVSCLWVLSPYVSFNLTEYENLQNSECLFCFLFDDFRLCSRYSVSMFQFILCLKDIKGFVSDIWHRVRRGRCSISIALTKLNLNIHALSAKFVHTAMAALKNWIICSRISRFYRLL